MQFDFKPSDVDLGGVPLAGTMGKAERECAAALLLRALIRNGDNWQELPPRAIGLAMKADMEEGVPPTAIFKNNPFWNPDFRSLVDAGYATFAGDPDKGAPVAFTDKGLAALRKYAHPSASGTASP